MEDATEEDSKLRRQETMWRVGLADRKIDASCAVGGHRGHSSNSDFGERVWKYADYMIFNNVIILCEGEGNGPVNALDNAIRENVDKLAKYSKYLKDLKLVDYKVRILNTGTEAVTRVSIESTDSKGKNWFTIGVSTNIIDASFKALVDSLDYKLFKDNAPASL